MRTTQGLALGVTLAGVALFAGTNALYGCSSSSSSNGTDGGGTDSGIGPQDTGTGGDTGVRQDTGTGGDTGTPPPTDGGKESGGAAFVGLVSAGQTAIAGTNSFSLSASFVASSGGTGTCTGTMMGQCCFTPPAMAMSDAGAPMLASAGTITIKDGTTNLAMLMPGANNAYTPATNPPTMAVTWMMGDTLNVSAAGDSMGVHMFSGMVTAVAPLAGVMPAPSLAPPQAIPVASNFTITWTAGTAGDKVVLLLTGMHGTNSDGLITCTQDDGMGSTGITVDSSLFTAFNAMGETGSLILSRTSTGMGNADNATVTIVSSNSLLGQVAYQ